MASGKITYSLKILTESKTRLEVEIVHLQKQLAEALKKKK